MNPLEEIAPGKPIYICGNAECAYPFVQIAPLCGAHRAMSEINKIPVVVDKMLVEF